MEITNELSNIQTFQNSFFLDTNAIRNSSEQNIISPFGSFFDEAVGLLDETNSMQKEAQQLQIDFITGQSDDVIGLTMAESRANTAVQFTTQVITRVLTAYNEIMRMSI